MIKSYENLPKFPLLIYMDCKINILGTYNTSYKCCYTSNSVITDIRFINLKGNTSLSPQLPYPMV